MNTAELKNLKEIIELNHVVNGAEKIEITPTIEKEYDGLREIFQAALERKVIEVRYKGSNSNIKRDWFVPRDVRNPLILLAKYNNSEYEYRVANNLSEYVPYSSSDEIFNYLKSNPGLIIKSKDILTPYEVTIDPIKKHSVILIIGDKHFCVTLDELYEDYFWSNGEPCGKIVV